MLRIVIAFSTLVAALLSGGAAPPQTETPMRADYPIRAVPLTAVALTDDFWRPRLDVNRTVTIPHILRQNEITGRIDNFLKAAHKKPGAYKGHRYDDTDTYKIIEAASYALAVQRDAALDRKLDEVIAIVSAAQESDGYLYAARTADPEHPAPGVGPERWSWLHTSHELYNQGHLYEAAVAHFQATGKRTLLDVAIKSADLVSRTFGPGRRLDVPGHEEIELALVKLAHVTGNPTYLETARFFIAQRGRPHDPPLHEFPVGDPFRMYNDLEYRQDHRPVREQTEAVGHAVRATYLYSGMTDVATLSDDETLHGTVDALWNDVVSRKLYLTGGLGAVAGTEAFADPYVLPNHAYAETCASIGGLLWYHRMFLREGKSAYYDVFERTLYNGYLSGVSLAGNAFFYQNPLVSDGKEARAPYFDVACCPANLSRLMAQLPGLIYAQRDRDVYVNLFVGNRARLSVGGTPLEISQETTYPWSGRVSIRVNPDRPAAFALDVRIPGWSRGDASPGGLYRYAAATATTDQPTLTVNGTPLPLALRDGYARIDREWKSGDVVVLDLPMPIRRVLADDRVAENRGRAAIERGPIVYCVEGIDNGGAIANLALPLDAPLQHRFDRARLGGVEVITGKDVVAIPYYAWNNRGKGEMAVWIKY